MMLILFHFFLNKQIVYKKKQPQYFPLIKYKPIKFYLRIQQVLTTYEAVGIEKKNYEIDNKEINKEKYRGMNG